MSLIIRLSTAALMLLSVSFPHAELWDEVTHHYADNKGVKIHYVAAGEGPTVVMIHDFREGRAGDPDIMFGGPMTVNSLAGWVKDTALHSDGLNNTWDWINADLTLVTTPQASHFVQQDAAELVTNTMYWWLKARL